MLLAGQSNELAFRGFESDDQVRKAVASRDDAVITIDTAGEGDHVVVTIGDNGAGIPPDVLPRIFDPFFTTKEVGKGTGQGLAIAHNIIREKHHGELSFQSRVGAGTTFRIALPVRQRVAA